MYFVKSDDSTGHRRFRRISRRLPNMTQPDWHEETTRRIATEIRRLRGNRSAQWLSDETAELGFRVSRSTISDMEVGRRSRLELVELLALAYGLRVPPLSLIYPDTPDTPVEYVPGITHDSWTAMKLFAGYEADPNIDNHGIELLRHHDELLDRVNHSRNELRRAQEEEVHEGMRRWSPDEQAMQERRTALAGEILDRAIHALRRHREDMRSAGVTPPAVADFADHDQQLDLFNEGEQP